MASHWLGDKPQIPNGVHEPLSELVSLFPFQSPRSPGSPDSLPAFPCAWEYLCLADTQTSGLSLNFTCVGSPYRNFHISWAPPFVHCHGTIYLIFSLTQQPCDTRSISVFPCDHMLCEEWSGDFFMDSSISGTKPHAWHIARVQLLHGESMN